MWISALVLVVGVIAVAAVTQSLGYRLGGTITVPVLAVYTLWDFMMLPVFLLSTVTAYLGLWLFRRRTLIYGRNEFVAAILIGSLVPLATLFIITEVGAGTSEVAFIGSVLPGLAAYNLHSVDPELRRPDVVATAVLFVGLFGLGWLLVTPDLLVRYGTATPPVLFSRASDIARYKGVAATYPLVPVIVPRTIAVSLFAAGFALSELLRERYGVRVGVIVPVLLAIYLLASRWLLVAYVVLTLLSFVGAQVVHHLTLRYGRVLLGLTVALAVALVLPLSVWLPVDRGLSAVFVGVLAGVTAYNAHASPPIERRLVCPLQLAVFVPSVLVARLFATPLEQGVPQTLGPVTLGTAGLLFVLSVVATRVYVARAPSEEAVESASVFSLEGQP
ncbi:hypothetical protein BRD18_05255 [Halobacteriales archaeon SW_7_71_33]|nr:MAG: hypothetical protein BRD18_05255 [Halobacteriales archaeon SW_7_71_33]